MCAGDRAAPDAAVEAVLERFDMLLAASHRARTTRRMYVAIARRWLLSGGDASQLDADALTRRLFARRRQVGPATINIELGALRAFYRAMHMLGIAASGEVRKIPRGRKVPRRLLRWLTDSQVGALLAQPDMATFTGLRDHTIIRLLYETGLRAGEMAALGCGDVLADRSVYVVAGKGGHSRYVPISADMLRLLDVYMAKRAARRPGKRAALWITQRGLPLADGRSVWEIVARHARAALGLAAGYDRLRRMPKRRPWTGHYPHLLRASFASALMQRGCPLTAIMQMLGHASLDTTALYLGGDITHLRAAIAKHPRFAR